MVISGKYTISFFGISSEGVLKGIWEADEKRDLWLKYRLLDRLFSNGTAVLMRREMLILGVNDENEVTARVLRRQLIPKLQQVGLYGNERFLARIGALLFTTHYYEIRNVNMFHVKSGCVMKQGCHLAKERGKIRVKHGRLQIPKRIVRSSQLF